MWGDVKMSFTNKIFSVRVLQNFYNAWKASNYTSAGYQNAMHSVERPDNPATKDDESITEKTVQHWAEDYFKKPWSQIYSNDVDANLNNIAELTSKLRELIVYQLDANHEIDGLDSEIKDLETIMKNDK